MSAVCGVSCTAALNWCLGGRAEAKSIFEPGAKPTDCVFVFDTNRLVTANAPAQRLISDTRGATDWDRLAHSLSRRFPTFPAAHTDIPPKGLSVIEPVDPDDGHHVVIEPSDKSVRVEVIENPNSKPVDTPKAAPYDHELELLREVTRNAPCPIWKVDKTGEEVWHNAAYRQLFDAAHGHEPTGQNPLFPSVATSIDAPSRQSIELQDCDDPAWYDITSFPHGDDTIFYGLDVAPIVLAETTQRNFVQTLSKTFAQLSTGLAIFDRHMQLVLFNPALIDLTALPADFLSARPNLLSFFDRLRDGQVMPEPKDYSSWRDKMTAMVAAANEGSYAETWTLPSGSTYQVSGRPHPDGAVAFLFEDISAEVSLTRRFRSDLELNQGILDELEDAIAVFSATGTLTVTNATYRKLWQMDDEASLGETTILDAMRNWQNRAGPSTLWGELRDFILGRENRAVWNAQIQLPENTSYTCMVHPILNGATLLRMSPVDAANKATQLKLAK